ncbi:MAG: PEP-CTERM sorting domain-containing protein [Sphingobacteriales bacterium]|nr:MAG: PEP-CTERM sorting domain-containing protein [Sphingobacteriales bacterium]
MGFDGTIDLGDGASVLRFADSTFQFWNGTLSITNWSGSAAGGGVDQLLFDTAIGGITMDQLALIQFVNPAGFQPGNYGARMLPNGEVVVIPEPATGMTLLLGGLGLFLGRRRKRF